MGQPQRVAAGPGDPVDFCEFEAAIRLKQETDTIIAAPEQTLYHRGKHRIVQQVLQLRSGKLCLLRHRPLQTISGAAFLFLEILRAFLPL